MRTLLLCLVAIPVLAAELPTSYTNGVITASVSNLDFYISRAPYQSTPPVTKSFALTSNGSQPVEFGFLRSPYPSPWVRIEASQTITPAIITVTVDSSNPWIMIDFEVLLISTGAGQGLTIPITFHYWPVAPGTPGLTLSENKISWSLTVGALPPLPLASIDVGFSITPTSQPYGPSGGFSATCNSEGNWLQVNSGYTALHLKPGNRLVLTVARPPTVPGTYSGVVHVLGQIDTSPGNTVFAWSDITVTLTVKPPAALRVGTQSLNFEYQIGGAAPPSQSLPVTTDTATSLAYTAAAKTNTGAWLSVSPGSGTTPSNLTVVVSPAGLAAGTYSGTIVLTPATGTGAAVSVPVVLVVRPSTALSVAPVSIAFSHRRGEPDPALQSIQVTGGAGLSFQARVTSPAPWLSVSPTSGTTPATVSVSVNPASLSPGEYNAAIEIFGTGLATGQITVAVVLRVTAPLPTVSRIVNAASYEGNRIAPGEIVTVFGSALGPPDLVKLALESDGHVATTLSGVRVLFNGMPAPLIYASESQIGAVVPYEVAGLASVTVVSTWNGISSNVMTVPVVATVPGVFTANASGSGSGAFLNQDYGTNSPGNPAEAGSTITLYVTGEGQTTPRGVTGKVTAVSPTPPFTPAPVLDVSVTIDGQPATVAFAGQAPGFVSGVMQLNVQIPRDSRAGDLPVVVKVGETGSQSGVTVAVR